MNKKEKLPLSVAVITLNEEDRLLECLQSVSFADDVVVIDSKSTDKTVTIAENFGARVFIESWRGYGRQKQFAIDQCKHDWVLLLDADERIPEGTAEEIYSLFAKTITHTAYSFPRKNYFLGRWIKHCGWWPDMVVRLFNKKQSQMKPRVVHESITTKGSLGQLKNPIVHQTCRNLNDYINKMNNYSTLGAAQFIENNVSTSPFKAASRALWGFFHCYVLRLGLLDGFQGFIIALLDAVGAFLKHAKLLENTSFIDYKSPNRH